MKSFVALVVVSLSLIACQSPKKPEEAKPAEPQQVKSEANSKVGEATESDLAAKKLAEEANLARQMEKESVYFDFDKSEIKHNFGEVVKKQADFMASNKNVTVTLEGNCDARGSGEYNLALGERRAKSVGSQLQTLGVSTERIKTVSNGEEKPRLTCNEEKCWKENRRADFSYTVN